MTRSEIDLLSQVQTFQTVCSSVDDVTGFAESLLEKLWQF